MKASTRSLEVIGCTIVIAFTTWLAIKMSGIMETVLLTISGGAGGYLIATTHGYFKEKKRLEQYREWKRETNG